MRLLIFYIVAIFVFCLCANAYASDKLYVCDDTDTYSSVYGDVTSNGYNIASLITASAFLSSSYSLPNLFQYPFLGVRSNVTFSNRDGKPCILSAPIHSVIDFTVSYSFLHANSGIFPNLYNNLTDIDVSPSCPWFDRKPGAYISTSTMVGSGTDDHWTYVDSGAYMFRDQTSGGVRTLTYYADGGDCHTLSYTANINNVPRTELIKFLKSVPYSVMYSTPQGNVNGELFSLSDIPRFAFGNYTSAGGAFLSQLKPSVELESPIRERWPFSEITTAIEWMTLLTKTPETPVFHLAIGTWEYDLVEFNKFDALAEFMRTILGVAFLLYILHSTRSLFLGVER